MKKKWYWLGVLGIFFGLLAGCGAISSKDSQASKVKVMTTFYPMYDFTNQIVGEEGEVELLIPAAIEPHEFEPSAKDVARLTESSVFIYNSNYFETWIPQVKKTISSKKTEIVEAAKGISLLKSSYGEEEHLGKKEESGEEHSHEEEGKDPHVWLSPKLAIKEVETIREGLIRKFPKKKAVFTKNAAAYLEKLKQLDKEYKAAFQQARQRKFVTQHAAFSYLARDYGLTQVAITGISPEEEPTPARLAELKRYVEKEHIEAIYFEETTSSKIAKTLAEEANVSTEMLNPLEGLSDSAQKSGENYLSVMRKNLKSLQKTIR